MRYSLVSRFKGTLLGALVGEKIASSSRNNSQGAGTSQVISLHWSDLVIVGGESLISLGRFDTEDWRKRQEQELKNLENSYGAILATLPIALFFHENTIKLRHNLLLAADCHHDPIVRDGILAVGYAIAKSLTETLTPATLISQTISFVGETPTSLPEKLLQINHLLESSAGLERAQAEVSKEEKLSYGIALAFYCFLSTIEDFRLSVLRAIQINNCSKTVGAITGALSGVYNSAVGIPVTWQVMLLQAKSEQGMTGSSRMIKLAEALVAVWSGVCDLAPHPDEVTEEGSAIAPRLGYLQATAAPRVIRSR
ncbi:ADP-ribosylglycohydrolase family protein [Mastigocladopsis repens]|uniref:ADP-ribosylglycohydrolase family protein n=1 Tax=Mastigocladopsis repens TaxID=221287 RepID=UPI00035CA06B|nr:ADP-ribosylglycohydrolase family protein [Mastigocladopsis repens]